MELGQITKTYIGGMEVVGIRHNEVELQGDFSGGTHNVCQKDWFSKEGIIIK